MKKIVSSILLSGSLVIAAPIVMESGYVKIGVSDDGTFGVGSTTSPGILYDINGTGNYGDDDYLTPGTPHEFFTVQITGDTNATYENNNKFYTSPQMPTTITGDIHEVTATSMVQDSSSGSAVDQLKIIQTYTLEENSKIVKIDVSIENVSSETIENVKFARGLDPDVDVNTYDSYDTNNTRGFDGSAVGLPVFPKTDVVIAEGEMTKKVISLLYTGSYPHNTNIDRNWGTLPSVILEGKDDGYGDYTINLALDLGTMAPGDIAEFRYGYVLGDNLEDLGDILPPEEPPVDEPGDNPPVVTPPTANPPAVTPPAEVPDQPYNRNDNPLTPQSGSAPAYSFAGLLMMMLSFGFFAYRRNTTKETRS